MPEKTIELCAPLIAPDILDSCDDCLDIIVENLNGRRGISKVHVKNDLDHPHLCLHYDPNQISAAAVQEIAEQAGVAFTARYRHETIPFSGMDAADAATTLTELLEDLEGMLHANVNYAAGLIFIAYDSTILDYSIIEVTILTTCRPSPPRSARSAATRASHRATDPATSPNSRRNETRRVRTEQRWASGRSFMRALYSIRVNELRRYAHL